MSYMTPAVQKALDRRIANPAMAKSPVARYGTFEGDMAIVFENGSWCAFHAEVGYDCAEAFIDEGLIKGQGVPLWLLVDAGLISEAERLEAVTYHQGLQDAQLEEKEREILARLQAKYPGGES